MKRLSQIMRTGVWLLAVLLLAGCEPTVQRIAGTYSYKLTGTYTIESTTGSTDAEFTPERGTMDLIRDSGDTLLVVLNPTSGSIATGTAIWEDGTLSIIQLERALTIKEGKAEFEDIDDITSGDLSGIEVSRTQSFYTTMSGEGSCYDGRILIDLTLYGKEISGNNVLMSDDLILWAKK